MSSAGILRTRDMDIVERAQGRAMKMMRRLEHLSSEEMLGEIGQVSEKKAEWGFCTYVKVHQCIHPF